MARLTKRMAVKLYIRLYFTDRFKIKKKTYGTHAHRVTHTLESKTDINLAYMYVRG